MSEHDHDHDHRGPRDAASLGSDEEVRAKYQRLLHLAESMRHVLLQLKDLVPKAFEEGFRRRAPEQEEPWLIDWLQSDTKRRLEALMPRPPGGPPASGDGA